MTRLRERVLIVESDPQTDCFYTHPVLHRHGFDTIIKTIASRISQPAIYTRCPRHNQYGA
jgi:hypothetical protein